MRNSARIRPNVWCVIIGQYANVVPASLETDVNPSSRCATRLLVSTEARAKPSPAHSGVSALKTSLALDVNLVWTNVLAWHVRMSTRCSAIF
ncbi:unnamed protein product [Heligmosomoides polygyrus]|uniref:Uncharacterized protein n=1 Tax=Heligmosomoides polygyrus TaxID=6339 RepID=A0A3P8EUQ9_HELPZ|nr:unnamed protein product [Heligmosomoides polygyrus]